MLTDLEKNAIRDHYQEIAKNLPDFRSRSPQRKMLACIANAFSQCKTNNENEQSTPRRGESIVVIEGPTGVGKSLAYLLAGGIMAQTREKKLVVSSATVALQEQLVTRDLPFLVKHSGLALTFALAKGRARYLCPYKLYQLTQSHAQDSLLGFEPSTVLWDTKPKSSELKLLREIADQFEARQFNGDRDSWPETIEDAIWFKVTNDRHSCLKAACPNRAECPFFLARETLDTVDVVVTNHDLLLADISMGGGVILPNPNHCFYCIDEAHHLPKKALSQFSAEHSLNQALWYLERISTTLNKVVGITEKADVATLAEEAALSLTEYLQEWQFHLADVSSLVASDSYSEPTWLWTDGGIPEDLIPLVNNCAISAKTLLKNLNQLNDALSATRRDKNQNLPLIDQLTGELGLIITKTEQVNDVWDLLVTTTIDKEAPLAKWITRKQNDKPDYDFHASPISSASQLANGLWKRAAGAVLTSATLQSLGNFDLLLNQTGLKWLPETTTIALDSPFDFSKQGELYIPSIGASPKEALEHTIAISEWLPKLIDISEAIGTLVLFSSRKQMQDVAMRLPTTLLDVLLVQGDLPKNTLLNQHRNNIANGKPSIIFGLDSFAEGLDLPGETCVQVIIAKLPFSMPDNPIEKTQSRWIEQRGGNPFMEITVPEASIKLIQAVGRLIRTETDYGRITILDNRILTARYGKQLLACLPPFKRIG